jgi:arylsulfatase A-like enzyme
VEYAGLDAPDHLEGESFAGVLEDPEAGHKDAAFTELGPYARSVRTENWRYIEWYRKGNQDNIDGRALYDHRLDPHETRNLAGRPEYAEKQAEMKRLLDSNWE